MNHPVSLSSRPLPWAVLQSAAALLRQGCAAWQRQRQARQNHLALCELDDRTLRDLGFERSEVGSLVAEIGAQAEPTRVRVLRAHQGLRT